LPEKLRALVSGIRSIEGDRLPILTGDDLDDARRALAVYREMPRTTAISSIDKMMASLAMAYPSQRISPEAAQLRLEVYAQGLADIAPDLLRGAMHDAVKVHKFFPSVAELRELAAKRPMGEHRWRRMVLERLVMAAEDRADQRPEDPAEAWTVERLTELPRFAAAMLRKNGAITQEQFDAAFPPVENLAGSEQA